MNIQDGFSVSWCDPSDEPQCAKTWDRDTVEDEDQFPDIGESLCVLDNIKADIGIKCLHDFDKFG